MLQTIIKSRQLAGGLSRLQQGATWQPVARVFTSSPALFDEAGVPTEGKSGQGAIVDPEQDGSLQEVLAVPVPKPLIPGAQPPCLQAGAREPAALCTRPPFGLYVSAASCLMHACMCTQCSAPRLKFKAHHAVRLAV